MGQRRSGGSSSGHTEGRGPPSAGPPSRGVRVRNTYSLSGRRVTHAARPDYRACSATCLLHSMQSAFYQYLTDAGHLSRRVACDIEAITLLMSHCVILS